MRRLRTGVRITREVTIPRHGTWFSHTATLTNTSASPVRWSAWEVTQVDVGAVAVLFLFVVMMLDIDFAELRAGFIRNFPLGLLLAIAIAPGLPAMPSVAPMSYAGLLILVQQILIGLALGFAMRIVFAAVEMAGEVSSLTMGLGVALLTTMVGLVGNIVLGLQLTRLDRYADALTRLLAPRASMTTDDGTVVRVLGAIQRSPILPSEKAGYSSVSVSFPLSIRTPNTL